ncbi:hypothetical protein [Nitrospira lenta]|uniref:hypothetical protein n=1 Tax=Nitrospira lenta TaxID=1436998 RepID=UPI0015E8810E|nr:hypothetical protein [Nitrospira lenta]
MRRMIEMILLLVLGMGVGAQYALPAEAQEVLPRPEAKFQGTIGQTYMLWVFDSW